MRTLWPPYWIVLGVLMTCAGVTSGLYFTVEPSDRVAVLSKPFWWDCSASDQSDQVTYSWTINQQSLPTSASQVIYSNGTLHIGRLTSDDVGVYVCSATSGGETITSREAGLELAYIDLSFGTSPASQTVFLGDTVILSCKITSLPPAQVTWTLNGKNVTQGKVTTTSDGEFTLTLSPVLYEDAGTYKCLATNQMLGVYRYSLEATLTIQGRPVFLEILRPVYVPLGFTATFTCYFHGNPRPEVRWLLHKTLEDGSVATAELQNSDKYQYFQNGTFHVFAVTYDDEGFYTCNTENVFGEMSESARLTVTGEASEPTFTREPVNASAPVEGLATFDCWCSGNPEPRSYWMKNGLEIVTSERVTLHQNGSLSLSGVQSTDMGWFSCVCENAVGVGNHSAFLNVQVGPSMTLSPQYATVLAGEAVVLNCDAEGNPAPQVSWLTPYLVTVSTTQLASGYTVFQNGSLKLKSAAIEDAGIYTCIAINSIGSVNQSVMVRVEAPPEFTTLPVSQSVNVGEKALIHCQATGVPRPSYTWSKDGEGLIRSTAERQIYLNNTLVVHSPAREDAGIYRCMAANVRGQVSSVATLSVLEPPTFTVQPSTQKVKVGDTVRLTCVAVGYPVPTQRWIKDGRQLVLDQNMVSLPDSSQLTIVGIQESQFGRYDCLATNMAGTVSATAWIETADLPVLTVRPRNTTVNQSATLILPCQGQADEAPSVQWYKGRGGERTLIQVSDRVTVSVTGELSFLSVFGSDEGWYTCAAYNSVGEVFADVFINVQVPPHIFFTNSPQSTLGRFSVTLICQSTGDPAPTLQWHNPLGVAVQSSSSYIVSGNTLEITVASGSTDAGEWTCRACNLLGCDSETLEVIIEGVPAIERFMGSKTGNIVTLTCEVTGEPSPSVTFLTQGQQVTMTTKGHTVNSDTLTIEEKYVRPQYSCQGVNDHGKVTKTLTVPGQPAAPTVTNIQSGWVTLRWSAPAVTLDSLPLIGYTVQQTSNHGTTWQNIAKAGDLLTSRYLNISDLAPYTEYSFRVTASNILGRGRFSGPSTSVRTLPGAPSLPTNVITLETGDGVYLMIWNPPASLNGPLEDIVYQYKVTKTEYDSAKGRNSVVIHSQGRLTHNQTRELEITVSAEPARYVVLLTAVNTRLNKSSDAVAVEIDISISGTQKQTTVSSVDPDMIIAIVFGVVGGVAAVCIIIFIVKHVRTQRKSESMSLVNPRLPLDQFYMENPKHLYRTDSRLSIKRRSGHSFYSFQEDDSFHGSRSMLKDLGGTPRKRGKHESDVLLVARNPLYNEPEMKSLPVISSRETTPDHQVSKSMEESCAQTEITAPVSEVMGQPSHRSPWTGSDVTSSQNDKDNSTTNEAITPLSAKDLEEDIMKIYCSMNSDAPSTTSYQPEQPQEPIYSSIHSDGQSSRSKQSSTGGSKYSNKPNSDFIMQKPPTKSVSTDFKTVTNGGTLDSTGTNSPALLHKTNSPTTSVGQRHHQNGDILSNLPKPPIKVLSLDGLRLNSPYKVEPEVNGTTYMSEGSVLLVHDNSSAEQGEHGSEVNGDESSDTDSLIAIKGGKSMVRPLDVRIEDNLLSEEEYHRDVVSADLY